MFVSQKRLSRRPGEKRRLPGRSPRRASRKLPKKRPGRAINLLGINYFSILNCNTAGFGALLAKVGAHYHPGGPTRPVVPGDRRHGHLVPSERPPWTHFLQVPQPKHGLLLEASSPGPYRSQRPPIRLSTATTVSSGYVRLPWTQFSTPGGGSVVHRVPGADVGAGKYVSF